MTIVRSLFLRPGRIVAGTVVLHRASGAAFQFPLNWLKAFRIAVMPRSLKPFIFLETIHGQSELLADTENYLLRELDLVSLTPQETEG